jgi:hypothetical protein
MDDRAAMNDGDVNGPTATSAADFAVMHNAAAPLNVIASARPESGQGEGP